MTVLSSWVCALDVGTVAIDSCAAVDTGRFIVCAVYSNEKISMQQTRFRAESCVMCVCVWRKKNVKCMWCVRCIANTMPLALALALKIKSKRGKNVERADAEAVVHTTCEHHQFIINENWCTQCENERMPLYYPTYEKMRFQLESV